MYHQHYQFKAMPFENTPDPRFFFASEQHREALAGIEYALRMRKGYVMVSGAIGSGKTTIATAIRQRCAKDMRIISLLHGHQDRNELLRQILRGLSIRCSRHDDHARLLERLGEHLQSQEASHRPVVLFIDEAQTLSDEALEELCLLSNFDTAAVKPIQVVLCGQPELRQRVSQPRHEPLRQRIVLAKQLGTMSREEVGQYIEHRIAVASQDASRPGVAFNPQAIAEIHLLSRGIPRLVNTICDNCLLLGMVRQADVIDPSMVNQVAQDMMMTALSPQTSAPAIQIGKPVNRMNINTMVAGRMMPPRLRLTGVL